MLTQPNSFNNKLILEAYKHSEVKAEIRSGWASVSQKSSLKGLKILVQATLLDSQPFAKNKFKSDTLPGEFILVTMNEVEYITPPEGAAA
jgi:hypothetical protein